MDLTVDFLSLDCRIFMSRSFAVIRSFCNLSYASAIPGTVTDRDGYSVDLSVMPSVQNLTNSLKKNLLHRLQLDQPVFHLLHFFYQKKIS